MDLFLYAFWYFHGWQIGLFWTAHRLQQQTNRRATVGVAPGLLALASLLAWVVT